MFRVRQHFDSVQVLDVGAQVRDQLNRPAIRARLAPGQNVAVAVGSRGVANIGLIVKSVCDALKALGVAPFIVPAMGSHGGATPEGQRKVLAALGVTDQTTGAEIRSSMEVVPIGQVTGASGRSVPLYMDRLAHEADRVVPVVRVKPHTGFKGPVESGICKMLAIGLGKHFGCAALHREGMAAFDRLIPKAGQVILETGKIGPIVAVVENALDQTALLEAVEPEKAVACEQALLVKAKQMMGSLLLPQIDVLVIEQFGKDISGAGMDPNVTGRGELGPLPGFQGPPIHRIVVLGLTAKTAGNAQGIGQADIVTEQVFDQIDRLKTWTNALTAGSLGGGKLPVALPTDEQAIMAAASCVPGVNAEEARIVRIRNTLALDEIAVSESLLVDVGRSDRCELIGPWDRRWAGAAA